ncbi:hypothetical protein [Neorhizobium sp. T25_13]|uniref:hypothetical protein n=1 Tax=Neorhizobium sp. T25_13 TaxID=2093830 RepID=UPI00155F0B80|nr:hypothetical protein [Neorhizobium sp. T25_13]
MSSYFLKQPNGNLAVFTTDGSRFTFCGMTEAEALDYGLSRWGTEAAPMIASGLEDRSVTGSGDAGDGLSRWRSALTDIAAKHGIDGVRNALAHVGMPEADIPQSALDAALEAARPSSP